MSLGCVFAAIQTKDARNVQRVLQKNPGIDLNELDNVSLTPLHIAVITYQIEVVRVLLHWGANVDPGADGQGHGWTPLGYAAHYNLFGIAQILKNAGADINQVDFGGMTVLARACRAINGAEVAHLLISAGADVNKYKPANDRSWTALHAAARTNKAEVMRRLLDAGADVDQRLVGNWRCGQTALHVAASQGHSEAVKILLDAGAEVDCIDCQGRTPLILAAMEGMDKATEILVEAGADVLHKDDNGLTAMQGLNHYFSGIEMYVMTQGRMRPCFNTAVALVAGGDRNWDCVPSPCPGLERALVNVWRNTPQHLPLLFKKLEKTVQARIQLYLQILHHALPNEDLRMKVMEAALEDIPEIPSPPQVKNPTWFAKVLNPFLGVFGIKGAFAGPGSKVNPWA